MSAKTQVKQKMSAKEQLEYDRKLSIEAYNAVKDSPSFLLNVISGTVHENWDELMEFDDNKKYEKYADEPTGLHFIWLCCSMNEFYSGTEYDMDGETTMYALDCRDLTNREMFNEIKRVYRSWDDGHIYYEGLTYYTGYLSLELGS